MPREAARGRHDLSDLSTDGELDHSERLADELGTPPTRLEGLRERRSSGAPAALRPSPPELSTQSRSMLGSDWVESQDQCLAYASCVFALEHSYVPAGASGSRTPSISKRLRREEAIKDKQVCEASSHLAAGCADYPLNSIEQQHGSFTTTRVAAGSAAGQGIRQGGAGKGSHRCKGVQGALVVKVVTGRNASCAFAWAGISTGVQSSSCASRQELDTTLQVLGIDGVPTDPGVSSPHALAALRRDSSSGFQRLHHSESGGTLRCSAAPIRDSLPTQPAQKGCSRPESLNTMPSLRI